MESIFGGYVFWNLSKLIFHFLTKKCYIFFFPIVGYFCRLFLLHFPNYYGPEISFLIADIIGTFLWDKLKELLIPWNLLEIELNGVHFWRLCFLELFEAKIQNFDLKMFYIFLHHSGVFSPSNLYFISPIIMGLKYSF